MMKNVIYQLKRKRYIKTNIFIAAPFIIIRSIYCYVLDSFKQCSIELSESMIYKPYCEKHCIVSAGNS